MKGIYKIILLAFVFRITLAFLVWHPDVNNHVDWGIRFWQYGPGEFYKANVWSFTWPNQPPGTIYIFAAVRKIFEAVFSFFWFININIPLFPSNIMLFFETNLYPSLLKLPAILADLGIAYLIFLFFREKGKEKIGAWAAMAFLVNPITWYNSSIWGQTDATINFFGLLSLLLLLERKLVFSFLSLSLSLFIKASLGILLPIFLIIAWRQRYQVNTWIKAISIPLVIIGILTLPFSGLPAQAGEPFSWLFNLYKDKVFGWQLHLITANAFNFWAALTGIHERPDTLMAGLLNFRTWGYILFGITFIPLLVKVYKKFDFQNILWVCFLTLFSIFVLATGMHERYLYPIFPLLTIITALERKWLPLLISISVIYLLNLYNFWWYPRIEWLIEFMSAWDRLLPRILGGVVTTLFLYVYVSFVKSPKVIKK